MKNLLKKGLALFVLSALLFGCSESDEPKATQSNANLIRIGTSVGDFGDMVKDYVGPELESRGYRVQLIEFPDPVVPNRALSEGEIDINIFQNRPYFESFTQLNGIKNLEVVFQAPTGPLGIYSGRKDDLKNVDNKTTVAITKDPSNYARSLILLEDLGWITLREGLDESKATEADIEENIHGIKFVHIDMPQLPRSRPDVDFAIITANFATAAGIQLDEALFQEPGYDYINWSAIRSEDADKPWVKEVESVYYSDGFKAYAKERFKGFKFPRSWES